MELNKKIVKAACRLINAGQAALKISVFTLSLQKPKGKQHGIKQPPSFESTMGWKSKLGVFDDFCS